MNRHHFWALLAFFLAACSPPEWWTQRYPTNVGVHPTEDPDVVHDGIGGGFPRLTLPFASGAYWQLTQGYGDDNIWGSHEDWGFRYGDDSKALDFSREGCTPFGEPVFSIAPGRVMEITIYGKDDHGYGNSVLVNHGKDYVSRYAHLDELHVGVGDEVHPGVQIGTVGNSGNVSGVACPEHPGTHLHLVLYKEEVGIAPLPLSGLPEMQLRCWYNREGEEHCGGVPDEYEPIDDDYTMHDTDEWGDDHEEDEVPTISDMITMDVSPSWGRANETKFVWSAVVDTPARPDVKLWIHNPLDNHSYDFNMVTESDSAPWVFTYRKDLQYSVDYEYWMETGTGESTERRILDVSPGSNHEPWFIYYLYYPDETVVGQNEFFDAFFGSETNVEMDLVILNGLDAVSYSFPMNVDETYEDRYHGQVWKRFESPIVYPYWTVVENERSITTSPVHHVHVSE